MNRNPPDIPFGASINDIDVDRRRIMHNRSVILSGENITSTAHVGRELINFIKTPVDHLTAETRITQVTDNKIIGLWLGEFIIFEIDTANPETFPLEFTH